MRFSLELPTQRVDQADEFVTSESITQVTRAAASAGFSAVNVTDHPAPDARWLDAGGHHALDPFVALSFAAAADPAIRLQTNIYVAAYRNPFLGAKQVQSLHVLSNGRLILGVAAGYLKPEFTALGIDFENRGALLDDALEVLGEALAGGDVAREGPGYRSRGVRFRPTPPSGRPPVWVGGNSRAAMARAARYEGWAPFHTAGYAQASRTAAIETVEDLAAAIAHIRDLVPADRRDTFDICWSEALLNDARTTVDQRLQRLQSLSGAGVTWANVVVPGTTCAEVVEGVVAFGRDVIAAHVGPLPD
jgi:probable F420-dependent oxidoreductase